MPETFDPYYRWLGISPKDQPPNHYRLLGIDCFEAEPDVIEGAADQRMAHLKRLNTGQHAAPAEKLLNEVAAARVCLLSPAKKAIYDEALRQQLDAVSSAETTSQPPRLAVLAVAAGLAVFVLTAAWAMLQPHRGDRSLHAERPPAIASSPSPPPGKQQSSPPAVNQEKAPAVARKEAVLPAAKSEAIVPTASQPSSPSPSGPPKKTAAAQTLARPPAPTDEAASRRPPRVGDMFKAERTKAKTPADYRALAEKFYTESRKTRNDAVRRTSLLQAALQFAITANDPALAFEIVDETSWLHEVDGLDVKTATFEKMLEAAKTLPQRARVVEQGCRLLEEDVSKEKFDLAGRLGQQLAAEAQKCQDDELATSMAAWNKQIKEQAAAFERFQQSQEALKSKPADEAANRAVAEYLCFVRGQWREGLPYLLKCGDKGLQRAAAMETPTWPTTGSAMLKLADAWWNLAQSHRGLPRGQLLSHAAAWYERARVVTSWTGSSSPKAEKQLRVIARLEAAESSGSAGHAAGAALGKDGAALRRSREAKRPHSPLVKTNGITFDLGDGVTLVVVRIPAGEFLMGDDKGRDCEKPVHKVRITKPFYLGKYDVTQQQWQAVMGDLPGSFKNRNFPREVKDPKLPVTEVRWTDCQAFLQQLTANFAGGEGRFTLPTEAQWEYACRAGTTTRYYFGNDESQLGEYAWYGANAGRMIHPVGEKRPNAWGLYDMIGNESQWCQDWYDSHYYASSPRDDPTGPSSGEKRVTRGARYSALRFGYQPDVYCVTFRVCLIPVDR
jgi:formylglycine-generating enzyme required for sulfatase activity